MERHRSKRRTRPHKLSPQDLYDVLLWKGCQAFLDGYAEEAIDEARSFLRLTLSLLASSPDETELEGVKTNDLYKFLNHIDNRLSEFEARKKLHF